MNMSDTRPVYIQLIDRIYTMVLSGQYPPGAKLPTLTRCKGLCSTWRSRG